MQWKRNWLKTVFAHLGLVALASLLFAGSFPNLLIKNGFPLLAWIAYIPVFVLIRRSNLAACLGWGALYGYSAYGLFNYWLSVFHPLAGLIVGLIYLVYLAVLFFALKLADLLFKRHGWLVQWIIWIAYEYLRTKGFLGYAYGITAYSQWRITPLIQIAGLFGVWGVSALVVFPSAWLGAALSGWKTASGGSGALGAIKEFFRVEKVPAIIWAVCLAASLVYGFTLDKSYAQSPRVNIALVQHNTDPWKPSKAPTLSQELEEYRGDLRILRRLSDEALAARPKPDLVVWPETAFVPRIYWHQTYRDDSGSWDLIKELLDYLESKDVPFVIGNDDALKNPALNPRQEENYRVDYNAALFFEKGKIVQTYRKLHLVPFTEHFPYRRQLPFMYRMLENADTHFWEKGKEATVFRGPGFNFSTPICFEDTFGNLSRNFARGGADVLVNLSNDAWSKSLPAQNQHLAMAVFRAVENRRSMARSTASGQTCGIDPAGRITGMARPFAEDWITVAIPLVKEDTLYTRYGDFLAIGFSAAAALLLLFGITRGIIRIKKGRTS